MGAPHELLRLGRLHFHTLHKVSKNQLHALTRLKNDQRTKIGIKNKRLKAGWDDNYLSQLLFETG
jgi:hypothetical protein